MNLVDAVWVTACFGAAAQETGPGLAPILQQGLGALGVLAFLSAWIVLKVGFVGMAVLFDAVCPEASARMVQRYQAKGKRPFFVGVLNLVVGVILALLLIASQALALLGLILLGALVVLIVIGYGVAYHNLGVRLVPPDMPGTRAKTVLLGGILAESAFFAPVLGQLLSLGMLFRGLGAVVPVLLSGRRAGRGPVEAPSPEAHDEPS